MSLTRRRARLFGRCVHTHACGLWPLLRHHTLCVRACRARWPRQASMQGDSSCCCVCHFPGRLQAPFSEYLCLPACAPPFAPCSSCCNSSTTCWSRSCSAPPLSVRAHPTEHTPQLSRPQQAAAGRSRQQLQHAAALSSDPPCVCVCHLSLSPRLFSRSLRAGLL